MEDFAKSQNGYFVAFETSIQQFLVNRNVVGNIEIRGYEDLLKPELNKKVVMGDASKSGSAFMHLLQMLDGYVIKSGGHYENNAGWEYVRSLIKNSVILQSSGAIHKAVADGEYGVALTWEAPSVTYLRDGAKNLEIVYPKECVYFGPSTVMLVKNCKNEENAKLFIDFILSEEPQNKMGLNGYARPTRKNAKTNYYTPYSDIEKMTNGHSGLPPYDEFITANSDRLRVKFTDTMTSVIK
ncbi:hypothetical protein AGMMS49574_26760 [Bacteroidia bacterium]|nr:hypothetical protein AGMMS49574_26760 [Bacteroidia bacterium]